MSRITFTGYEMIDVSTDLVFRRVDEDEINDG